MVDLGLLNHSVLSTWGDRVVVRHGNIGHRLDGVLIEAGSRGAGAPSYREIGVGNADVEQSDPFFSFRSSEFLATGATQGDLIEHNGVSYTIVADPFEDGGDWVKVRVRVYG